jgi:hypothetical protein
MSLCLLPSKSFYLNFGFLSRSISDVYLVVKLYLLNVKSNRKHWFRPLRTAEETAAWNRLFTPYLNEWNFTLEEMRLIAIFFYNFLVTYSTRCRMIVWLLLNVTIDTVQFGFQWFQDVRHAWLPFCPNFLEVCIYKMIVKS